jgi:dienelactone hydrolase
VTFGAWGNTPAKPAPTLLVFSGSIESTLGPENEGYYRQCGTFLAAKGYLCVSLDLPCHGREQQEGESNGLRGWRERIAAGGQLMEPFVDRARAVLDHLVEQGLADPKRIAACGVSRGGFAALHLAAREPRIVAVAAFAPVTELAALSEFAGTEQLPAVRSLSLSELAPRLVSRPIWLAIGDQDHRVDTDRAIAFARQVSRAAQTARLPGAMELHVLPEPGGHTTSPTLFEKGADWIDQQVHPNVTP